MSIAFWCLLVAGLLPLAAVGIAKADKSYLRHNAQPREWEAHLTGRQARAHAAHLNSFEAFPFFAVAVLVAAYCRAPQAIVDYLAMAFIAARVAYIWCYVSNRPSLRSTVWMIGFGVCIALFFVAAFAR
ncbi:MAG: MAPEG family protein [Betaproteobacteria bacterium]